MSTLPAVTMEDLELEHAELLPRRETLGTMNGPGSYGGGQSHSGFSFSQSAYSGGNGNGHGNGDGNWGIGNGNGNGVANGSAINVTVF